MTDRLSELFWRLASFFKMAVLEVFDGFRYERIPSFVAYPGLALAVVVLLGWEASLLNIIGLEYDLTVLARKSTVILLATSGWLIWAFARAAYRIRVLSKLKDAFESCGWKTLKGYPSFIHDVAIDGRVRRIRLNPNGVPKAEFTKTLDRFEAALDICVVKIFQDPSNKSRVDILYTSEDLPQSAYLEHPERLKDGDIPIGMSYDGNVIVNFRDVGHLLVAGQTGGGKSNFLKLIASILLVWTKGCQVTFMDFKGGLESADLKHQLQNVGGNIEFIEGSSSCILELARLDEVLSKRLTLFNEVGAKDFDAYARKQLKKKAGPHEGRVDPPEKRLFILIDEIAQLYYKETGVDKKQAELARASVNRIARQGRAAGIHLVAATQKPDSTSFDQTVKANLPGVLCFPMPNQAASDSALGSKRAFDLNPDIEGRAIWKFGPKMTEVQTFKFT